MAGAFIGSSVLLANAKKFKLDLNPLAGEELQQNVDEIFKLDPALVEKLKEILK